MPSILDKPYFRDEAAAYAKLESIVWPNGPVCVHCGETNRIGLLKGTATRPGVYKCYRCRKQFRVTVGTVFEASHIALRHWLQAVFLMVSSKKGVSSNQIHRTMGITLKSAWFMTHRIREAMKQPGWPTGGKLGGSGMVVEADETFVGGKAANRAYGPIPLKQAVFALVERNGGVRSFHVPDVTAANLVPIIARHAHVDSRFMTDEANTYSRTGRWFRDQQTVNHAAKEYVRDDAYTNTLEGYFSILKRGIYGIYQHVSEAHLNRYLAEFDIRHTNRIKTGSDDMARMDRALAGIVDKRLTYRGTDRNRATAPHA
ncbi:IS1595 family transposase [Rhodopila sp.]|uniref:IS1595 family transposase n=1 Tax=Rhodopila sp. TaxID=2480087 RepID=UPI003D149628